MIVLFCTGRGGTMYVIVKRIRLSHNFVNGRKLKWNLKCLFIYGRHLQLPASLALLDTMQKEYTRSHIFCIPGIPSKMDESIQLGAQFFPRPDDLDPAVRGNPLWSAGCQEWGRHLFGGKSNLCRDEDLRFTTADSDKDSTAAESIAEVEFSTLAKDMIRGSWAGVCNSFEDVCDLRLNSIFVPLCPGCIRKCQSTPNFIPTSF